MKKLFALIVMACLFMLQCRPKPVEPIFNRLSGPEIIDGWKLLFDGKTFTGWRNFGSDTIVGWSIDSGNLVALGLGGDHANDIITEEQFSNFELSVEWKTSHGGNSGIFYNALEDTSISAIYEIAPEYQIIDEVTWDGEPLTPGQKTASCYDMYFSSDNKKLKPVGEYNVSKIVVHNGHVEHWLNGELAVAYDLWTPQWDSLKSVRKWKDYPIFGTAQEGHIGLQDHGKKTWFRNIKIREIGD